MKDAMGRLHLNASIHMAGLRTVPAEFEIRMAMLPEDMQAFGLELADEMYAMFRRSLVATLAAAPQPPSEEGRDEPTHTGG